MKGRISDTHMESESDSTTQTGDKCQTCNVFLISDEETGELLCGTCGRIYEERIVEEKTVFKFDSDGNSQRQHEPGILGTDLTKTASKQLRKATGNHPVPDKRYDQYTKYALRCVKYFLKSETRFEIQRAELENRIIKKVQNYVKIKKETRESIESKKSPTKHKDTITNAIYYPAIDILLRKTIVEFCLERKEFANNIKPENIRLHKTVRHTKNGNNGQPRGTYKKRFEGLKDNTCMEHGRFDQKSHLQHWRKVHSMSYVISYPTYLDKYVAGYYDWRLKKNKNQILAEQKNNFSKISNKCSDCGGNTGLQKKTVPCKWKNGKVNRKRTYEYVYEYHVVIIGGVKHRISKCPAKDKINVCI